METLSTSFWFWFVVLGSMGVAVIAAFLLGRDLGTRATDLIWRARIEALMQKVARETGAAYDRQVVLDGYARLEAADEPAPADGVRPYRVFSDEDLDEIVASVFHEFGSWKDPGDEQTEP